jgi:lactoylglutathione lyase
MNELRIQLLVLRCKDVEVTRLFYERLGMVFTKEKHAKGPEHYASNSSGFVLELYPAKDGEMPDRVRLGFSTPMLADVSANVLHRSDVTVLKPPYATADYLILLLQDPDGRKVEISQALHR